MRMLNLRYYLSACRLPEMPVAQKLPEHGHKSHKNNLQIVPEPWRRLESINLLSKDELNQHISEWTSFLPEKSMKIAGLTIPCPLLVPSNEASLRIPATTTAEVIPWIMELPLKTTQCAMHAAFPVAMKDYSFHLVNDPRDLDKDLFQAASWSKKDPDTGEHSMTRLVVAFQPPWILSDKDIQMFQRCLSFPPFIQMGNAFPLSDKLVSQHRLWAKVHDLCVKQQTHWFVLTSYNSWVFGAFSKGWTHAFVTNVFDYNAHNPTIAEHLMFWIGCAMHLSETSTIPDYPEPVENIVMPIGLPDQKGRVDYDNGTESESHWDGKSEDAPSSAGVNSLDPSIIVSVMSNDPSPGNTVRYHTVLRQSLVHAYVADQPKALNPDDPNLVPRGVTWPPQFAPQSTPMGEWLV